MAKRNTSEAAVIEYVASSNYMRLTSEAAVIEYTDAANSMRLSSIGAMIEYVQLTAPPASYGPKAQMMG